MLAHELFIKSLSSIIFVNTNPVFFVHKSAALQTFRFWGRVEFCAAVFNFNLTNFFELDWAFKSFISMSYGIWWWFLHVEEKQLWKQQFRLLIARLHSLRNQNWICRKIMKLGGGLKYVANLKARHKKNSKNNFFKMLRDCEGSIS